MSGRLGGVPGGESRFRLLAIIREAAARRKGESPVMLRARGWRPGRRRLALGLNGEGAAGVTLWLHSHDGGAWGWANLTRI